MKSIKIMILVLLLISQSICAVRHGLHVARGRQGMEEVMECRAGLVVCWAMILYATYATVGDSSISSERKAFVLFCDILGMVLVGNLTRLELKELGVLRGIQQFVRKQLTHQP